MMCCLEETRWQEMPKPIRLVFARLLVLHLWQTWGESTASDEARGEVERGEFNSTLGRFEAGHARPSQ